MWSFGCILVELVTGRPLFPALDEQELVELIKIRIGMPPEEMIKKCKKRRYLFSYDYEKDCYNLIRSKKSRVPASAAARSDTIRRVLYSEGDEDFIDFIEVSDDFLTPCFILLVKMANCLISSYWIKTSTI